MLNVEVEDHDISLISLYLVTSRLVCTFQQQKQELHVEHGEGLVHET